MIRAALGIVAGFTVVTLLFWPPPLAITRLRELSRWPISRLVVNYPLIGSVLFAAQFLSCLIVTLLTTETGTATGGDTVGIVSDVPVVNLLFPSTLALITPRVLPERGHRTSTKDGLSPRLTLGIDVVWYGIVTSVGLVLIGLVVTFANLPLWRRLCGICSVSGVSVRVHSEGLHGNGRVSNTFALDFVELVESTVVR